MLLAEKVLWIMERNSERALSLPDLARACGVSRSHLAQAFGSATGAPVMTYLRGRRLSEAARVLASGAPDILSVAFDAGYNSHEAFTRAFREQFDMAPEALRDRGSIDGLKLTPPLDLGARAISAPPAPVFKQQETIRAVGLPADYELNGGVGIPAQWQAFMSVIDQVRNKHEGIPIGINQMPDEQGRFRYVCAAEVARFEAVPANLEAITLDACRCAVFEHRGHVSAIYDTYRQIWNDVLPALGCIVSDAPIVERHNPDFDPGTGEGGLTLWIPLVE